MLNHGCRFAGYTKLSLDSDTEGWSQGPKVSRICTVISHCSNRSCLGVVFPLIGTIFPAYFGGQRFRGRSQTPSKRSLRQLHYDFVSAFGCGIIDFPVFFYLLLLTWGRYLQNIAVRVMIAALFWETISTVYSRAVQ